MFRGTVPVVLDDIAPGGAIGVALDGSMDIVLRTVLMRHESVENYVRVRFRSFSAKRQQGVCTLTDETLVDVHADVSRSFTDGDSEIELRVSTRHVLEKTSIVRW